MHVSRLITYPPFNKESVEDFRVIRLPLTKIESNDPNRKYTEIMIPTSSYRMGVLQMGFGLAVLGESFFLN